MLVITFSSSHFDFAAPLLGLRLDLALADIAMSGWPTSLDSATLAELPLQFLHHSYRQLTLDKKSDGNKSLALTDWFVVRNTVGKKTDSPGWLLPHNAVCDRLALAGHRPRVSEKGLDKQ